MFLLVFSINLIDQISKEQSLIDRWDKTLPFLLMAVLSVFALKKFKINSILYAIIGIFCFFSSTETGNLTGVIFIIFSVYIAMLDWVSVTVIVLGFISIGLKVFKDFSANQIIILILGFIYTGLIYYILIHPKPTTQKIIYCQNLDPETVQIIQYLADGYIYKEIAPMVELTEAAIRKRITRAKELMQVKSTTELVIKCHKLEYIRYKIDKVP